MPLPDGLELQRILTFAKTDRALLDKSIGPRHAYFRFKKCHAALRGLKSALNSVGADNAANGATGGACGDLQSSRFSAGRGCAFKLQRIDDVFHKSIIGP